MTVLHRKEIDSEKPLVIGRESDCDIFVGNPRISRKHVSLSYDDKEKVLKITKLTGNPVRVNGVQIEKDKPTIIHIGDTVKAGPLSFKICEPSVVTNAATKPLAKEKEKDDKDKENKESLKEQEKITKKDTQPYPSPKIIYGFRDSAKEDNPGDKTTKVPDSVLIDSNVNVDVRLEEDNNTNRPSTIQEPINVSENMKKSDINNKQKKKASSMKVKEPASKKQPEVKKGKKKPSNNKTTEEDKSKLGDETNITQLIEPDALAENIIQMDEEEAEASALKKSLRSKSNVKKRTKKLNKSQRKRLVSSKLSHAKNEELKDILVVAAKKGEDIASKGIRIDGTEGKIEIKPIIIGGGDTSGKTPVVDATYDLAYKLGVYAAKSDRTHDSCIVGEKLEESKRVNQELNALYKRLSENMRIMENAITDLNTEILVLEHDYKEAYRHISAPLYLPTEIVKHYNLQNREFNFTRADIDKESREQNFVYNPM